VVEVIALQKPPYPPREQPPNKEIDEVYKKIAPRYILISKCNKKILFIFDIRLHTEKSGTRVSDNFELNVVSEITIPVLLILGKMDTRKI